jgi:hypothetical protein
MVANRMLLACAWALSALAPAAHAQIYKCQEGGRTVITDQPCAAGSEMKVKPAAGSFDPKAREEVYRRIDRMSNEVQDGYRAIAEQQAREAPRAGGYEEPDECDRLREDHADAKRWEKEFVHPDNIAREKARKEKAASDSFFKCGPGKRVSVFDE